MGGAMGLASKGRLNLRNGERSCELFMFEIEKRLLC